ncbi:hypothetical protein AMECASPLE_023490 [Ameca splendens]|uniref:Uncharacterized protein n=1 Tax=Ameca splendens TaxID=208324 RepID=A0ABV0Z2Y6_9TELE
MGVVSNSVNTSILSSSIFSLRDIITKMCPFKSRRQHFNPVSDLQHSLLPDEHVETVERKNSLLTGRNLQQNQNQAQCERPSATTDWGFERTEQRHNENKEALIQEYFLWEGKVNVNGCSSFSCFI